MQLLEIIGAISVLSVSYFIANSREKSLERIIDKNLELENDIKNLHKTILFDNDILIQKTEITDFMENKIVEIDRENCELKRKNFNLEQEKSLMMPRLNNRKVKKLGGRKDA